MMSRAQLVMLGAMLVVYKERMHSILPLMSYCLTATYFAGVGVRSQDVVGQNFRLLVHHIQELLQNLQF